MNPFSKQVSLPLLLLSLAYHKYFHCTNSHFLLAESQFTVAVKQLHNVSGEITHQRHTINYSWQGRREVISYYLQLNIFKSLKKPDE